MQFDRDQVYVNGGDPADEAEDPRSDPRQAVLASIKAALVTSRLTLGANDPGVDPYNNRLGKRPQSAWTGRR